MMTADDCIRAAFQALLRGDTAERDRLCALAKNIMLARERLEAGGPIIEGQAIRLPDVIALPDRSHETPQ